MFLCALQLDVAKSQAALGTPYWPLVQVLSALVSVDAVPQEAAGGGDEGYADEEAPEADFTTAFDVPETGQWWRHAPELRWVANAASTDSKLPRFAPALLPVFALAVC